MSDADFQFNRADLTRPRPFGISAYMRIKNEAEFVRAAIESHLPFYDEIICVHNDCTDNTESILLDLQQQHPDKIKVYEYLPKVHRVDTPEHAAMVGRDDDVHSMANYYNWTMAKCSYSIAAKLDGDHIAIPRKLKPAVEKIRAEFYSGVDKVFLHSGLNLLRDSSGQLAVWAHQPFSGGGDHLYHRIDERAYFVNNPIFEEMNTNYCRSVPQEHLGILYMHLHYLKQNGPPQYSLWEHLPMDSISFAEFKSAQYRDTLVARLDWGRRLRFRLYQNNTIAKLAHRITGKYPTVKIARLLTLHTDLEDVDLGRDLGEWLGSDGC